MVAMCAVRSPAAPHSDWFPSRSDTSTRRISAIGAPPGSRVLAAVIQNGCGFPRSRPALPGPAREPAGEVTRVNAPGAELRVGQQRALQSEVCDDPLDGAAVQGAAQRVD